MSQSLKEKSKFMDFEITLSRSNKIYVAFLTAIFAVTFLAQWFDRSLVPTLLIPDFVDTVMNGCLVATFILIFFLDHKKLPISNFMVRYFWGLVFIQALLCVQVNVFDQKYKSQGEYLSKKDSIKQDSISKMNVFNDECVLDNGKIKDVCFDKDKYKYEHHTTLKALAQAKKVDGDIAACEDIREDMRVLFGAHLDLKKDISNKFYGTGSSGIALQILKHLPSFIYLKKTTDMGREDLIETLQELVDYYKFTCKD